MLLIDFLDETNEVQDEVEYKLFIGLKHIEPFVEDAVEAMINE